MIDNKELAEYLCKRIKEEYGDLEIPTEDDLSFWIQQFKTRKWEGHTEWNEMYKINVWIEDKEDI